MAHAHHHPEHPRDIRQRGGFIISGLTSGHGVFHWFTQSLIAMLPEVQAAFGLSGVGVGGITATREVVSGLVTLPGGVIIDALRKHWGLVLAVCMALFGIGWLIIGFSQHYYLLLFGMAVVALAASIWHLPAMASLSHHFARRKGTALSFHGVGGQIGDALAPPATGVLLGFLAWRDIISIYAALPIFLAFLVFWAFRNIGRTQDADAADADGSGSQFRATSQVLRNPILWIVAFIGGIRGMAFIALITFLPIFLNDLGMSALVRNLHLGLLMAVGIVSTPVVGYLSDRFGRKMVLIPGLLLLAALSFLLSAAGVETGEVLLYNPILAAMSSLLSGAGVGIMLIIIIALMGTFLFGDQPILTALALDVAGGRVPTTVLGILSFERFLLSAASPLIAGKLYDDYGGADTTFIYVAALFALGAITLLFVPLRPSNPA